MPLYDYKCTQCKHCWDEWRSLGNHDVTCPVCGGSGRHIFAPVLFKFKLPQRKAPSVGEDQVYSRTYAPGQTIGDPMLDDGFERVE